MKKFIVTAAALLLIGQGCALPTDQSEAPEVEEQMKEKYVDRMIDLPKDEDLLPKQGEWKKVDIKNFGHPYSVEIHPWWHWNYTADVLKAGGAVFASSGELIFKDSGDTGHRIVWYGSEKEEGSKFNAQVSAALINQCDLINKIVNGFKVCVGHAGDQDSFVRGIALKYDDGYEWMPSLTQAAPELDGVALYLHMLETFEEIGE